MNVYNDGQAKNTKDMFSVFYSIVSNKSDGIPNSRFLKIHYSKIEAILLFGYSVRKLSEILTENGFIINAKTLKTELFRIRKKLGKKSIREQHDEILFSVNWNYDAFNEKILNIFNTPLQPYRKYDE
jgi:hypothetical protein